MWHYPTLSFHLSFAVSWLVPFTLFYILKDEPLNTTSLLGLFGLALMLMLGCGLSPVMSMFQGTMTHCYSTLHICKSWYLFSPDPSWFIRITSSLKWLHLFTSIDWFTRWSEAIPLTNIRAENTVVRFHIFVSHQEWKLIIDNTLNLLSGDTSQNLWNLFVYKLKPITWTHQTFSSWGPSRL